jgi:hypothetical protein
MTFALQKSTLRFDPTRFPLPLILAILLILFITTNIHNSWIRIASLRVSLICRISLSALYICICARIHLSLHLSVNLSIYYPSFRPSFGPFVSVYDCVSVWLSVFRSIHPPIQSSIRWSLDQQLWQRFLAVQQQPSQFSVRVRWES